MKRYMIWNTGSLGWGFRFGISAARSAPVQRFESVRYYKTHRAEAVKKIIAQSKLPDAQMGEAVYENSLRSTPDDGKPTLKGMAVVLDAAAKENSKARALTVQQLVDLRYFQ